jgi:transcriptional regulator with XRE-family HTH domain
MDTRQLIGKRIKSLRQAKALSQEQLAERIGISHKYLSSIERGKENPTLETFIRLADALNVETSEIFRYQHEKPADELRKIINDWLNHGDPEKLKSAARLLETIYQ